MPRGFTKGNKLAVGAKGNTSNHPTKYEKFQDAKWHHQIWNGELNVDELEEKIKKRVYSGRDMAAFMLLNGNSRIVGKFMDKLIPDLSRLVDENGKDVLSMDELAKRIANIRAKKK